MPPNRVISPPKEQWDRLRQPLTKGERQLLEHLDAEIDPAWEIYPRPALNGHRPDIVLLNPHVGIHIIEVKDWRLSAVRARVHGNGGSARLIATNPAGRHFRPRDPIAQIVSYEDEVVSLYCPTLSRTRIGKAAVSATLVFTNESTERVQSLLRPLLESHLSAKSRPYVTVMGKEALSAPIEGSVLPRRNSSRVMSEEAAEELRWWLREPHHDKTQHAPSRLSSQQVIVASTRTDSGYRRVRGPAGSGKSLCLAARAAKLQREGKSVLIISFNLTLLNYLRDLSVRFDADPREITWLNFHLWCKRIALQGGHAGNYNAVWRETFDEQEPLTKEEALVTRIPELVRSVLETDSDHQSPRWDAILVDEGQDFRLTWWNCLRHALAEGGEMLLVADRAQDVYGVSEAWTEHEMEGAGFRGPWVELKTTYRLPGALVPRLRSYLDTFLPDEFSPPLLSAEGEQLELEGPCTLRWIQVSRDALSAEVAKAVRDLQAMATAGGHDGAYADIVVLCERIADGREVVDNLTRHNIQVRHTFARDGADSRGQKRTFFQGSERVKATTIHSYKGWEAPLLVVGLATADNVRSLRLAYTALSRLLRSTAGSTMVVVCAAEGLAGWAKGNWPGYVDRRQLS